MKQPRCPRCARRLYTEIDDDSGECIVHGPQFLGAPLEAPPPKHRSSGPRTRNTLPATKAGAL